MILTHFSRPTAIPLLQAGLHLLQAGCVGLLIALLCPEILGHDPSLQAVNEYNIILKKDPDNVPTLRARGSTFRALELYDDALNDLNRANTLEPGDAETLCEIGICQYMLGETDIALDTLLESEDLMTGQIDSGDLTEKEYAPIERDLRETLLALYRDRGEFAQALLQWDRLEKYLGGKLAFRCDKADLLLGLGEVEEALLLYEEAVEWNKVFERYCVGAANCYILAGFINKATEVFDAWILEEPDNALPHMFRSLILRDYLDDATGARQAAAEALRLAKAKVDGEDLPDFGDIINLARVHQAAGEFAESSRVIDEILEYSRGHYLVVHIQAINFQKMGRLEEAASFEKESLLYKRLNPGDWLVGYDLLSPISSSESVVAEGPESKVQESGSNAERTTVGGFSTLLLGGIAVALLGAAFLIWHLVRKKRGYQEGRDDSDC